MSDAPQKSRRIVAGKGLIVELLHHADYDADASYLGTYVDREPAEYFVDRQRGILYGERVEFTEDFPTEVERNERLNELVDLGYEVDEVWSPVKLICHSTNYDGEAVTTEMNFGENTEDDYEQYVRYFNRHVEGTFEEVRSIFRLRAWGNQVLAQNLYSGYSRNEYKYWVPENHLPYDLQDWDHVDPKVNYELVKKWLANDVRLDAWLNLKLPVEQMLAMEQQAQLKESIDYVKQDFERHEKLGDYWGFVGVEVTVNYKGVEIGSAAVWGVEDDSGDDYLWECAKDELGQAIDDAKQFYSDTTPPEVIAALDEDKIFAALKDADEHNNRSLWKWQNTYMTEEEQALYAGKELADDAATA